MTVMQSVMAKIEKLLAHARTSYFNSGQLVEVRQTCDRPDIARL